MFFNWKKKGLIFKVSKKYHWNKSHAMLPTPMFLKNNTYRIFYASRNKANQSYISFIDYDLIKNEIVFKNNKPSFIPGSLGSFDDNGVVPSCVIKQGKIIYLYYIGWKPQATTRYSLIAGLAFSHNNGLTFKRYSKSPILKTSDREPYMILTAPSVLKVKNIWKMWYVSCEKWINKDYPIYNIKNAISTDGKNWSQTGKVCIKLNKNERAVARPSVIYKNGKYLMWYCKENKVGTYTLGYATSSNGLNWKRFDKKVGLSKSKKGWDSKMIAYPSVIEHKNKHYMLFNGNYYGKTGFGIAEEILD